jgi:hypothetical protein
MYPTSLTAQEVFDRVAVALLKQDAYSKLSELDRVLIANPKFNGCAYRGLNGCRCAVGHLIADEHYRPTLEGQPVMTAQVQTALLASGALSYGDTEDVMNTKVRLLRAMQHTHDNVPIGAWADSFRKIAAVFRLSTAAVDDFVKGAKPCAP